jgi:lipopolysaccharide/colanic/teichoic acid biosynthesis glycosyltransferase
MSTAARALTSERNRREEIECALRAIPQGPAKVPRHIRAVEVTVALIALTLTAPLQLLMALLIRRGTPGPALFHQPRVGVNGRLFPFVKFRTLYHDAKLRWPELYAYDYTLAELDKLKYKHATDPRVTPQGKWMRFSSLDELPNFWNVLKGDVALVGPRPEIPEMLPYYDRADLRKFSVRPGITGLAQISGRGRLSFKEVVAYDVEYVDHRSFLLDLRIVVMTAWKIVTRDGAF